jgi:hypothetical protein
MPRFDGTGPRGTGPMTGRGQGYCALEMPEPGRPARGYAGLEGRPVRFGAPAAWPARRLPTAMWRGSAFGRGRGWAARRGRGRRPRR